MSPNPGDIFLAPMPGAVGRLIRVGQWLNGDGFSKVQHAGVYLGAGRTLEAMPGGAVIGWLDSYPLSELVWSPWDLTAATRNKIVQTSMSYKGVPYSFVDYLAIAAHRFRLPLPWLKSYVSATGHMICSQLVDTVYHDSGLNLFSDGRWPGYVTPGSLYNRFTTGVAA